MIRATDTAKSDTDVPNIAAKPFLWGAVKSALVRDAKEHGPVTLLRLCKSDEQRVKEMMVAVLVDLGRDNLALVNEMLESLLPPEKPAGKVKRVWQLVLKPSYPQDKPTLNARKIAVEVASTLGNAEVLWVLKSAAVHPDPALRAACVRCTYHLWERDRAAGFEVLEYLAENVMHGLVPDLGAFESAVGLSLVIFFYHTREVEVLKRLQAIWRVIINKLLLIREKSSRIGGTAREFIVNRVFSIAISTIFRTLDEMPKGYTVINYPDLEAFFKLGAREKELYKRLIRYLDPGWSGPKEEMEADILTAARVKDMLMGLLVLNSIVAHAMDEPLAILPFLRRLIETCITDPQPNHILAYVPRILGHMMDRGHMEDEVFDLLVYALDMHQEYYAKNPNIPGLTYTFYAPQAEYLSGYVINKYLKTGTVRSEWIMGRIDAALERGDSAFFDLLFKQELPFTGIEMLRPQVALETLGLFINNHESKIDKEIEALSKAFLSRMRMLYPDEVDDFLESYDLPTEFRLQVLTNEPVESIGEMIGGQRAYLFVRDDVIFGSAELRGVFMDLLAKTTDYPNAREWLHHGLRQVINLVYGGAVLRPPR